MSTKTLGDYMKMLNSVEDESVDDKAQATDKCSCGHDPSNCNCPSDCECGCNKDESIEENVDVKNQDLNNTWQESDQFLAYVKDNIETLHKVMSQGLTEIINDGKEYRCNEYLIVGVTLEQGLMVVIRCEDEYEDQHTAHIEIKGSDVTFVEFVDFES